MRPLFIFDLDGTLALTDHRQHLVQCEKPDWRAFFAACVHDQPNMPVIDTFQSLRKSGAECWVWSGRSDEVRADTEFWLRMHDVWPKGLLSAPEAFQMRAAGDHTPDEKLKFGWLADLEPPERNRLTAVFDDRDKVVAMWREAGVPCFQVAPGAF